jgi:hypothetical protein
MFKQRQYIEIDDGCILPRCGNGQYATPKSMEREKYKISLRFSAACSLPAENKTASKLAGKWIVFALGAKPVQARPILAFGTLPPIEAEGAHSLSSSCRWVLLRVVYAYHFCCS